MRTISAILLSLLVACGSPSNNTSSTPISVGGTSGEYVGPSLGGTSDGGATTMTLGGNGLITGGTSNASGGSAINGGSSNNGGDTSAAAGDTSAAGQGAGGGSSFDVPLTGGTGTTRDVGSGGGSSIDVSTGGGWTLDTPTGGGSSIDVATGGGSSIDVATGGGSSVDVPTGGGTSIDIATGGAPSIDLGCKKTVLTSINVYVIKDATPTGADTEGNMYVGGNLTASNYSIGKKDTIDCTQYSLVVRGNVTGALVYGGKAVSSGTISNSTDQDCGGITRGTLPVDFDLLEAQVNNLSTSLSQLPTNGTVSGSLNLVGTDPTLNVFNITAAQLNTTQVNVTFPANSSVVVNVSGTSINWVNGSVCLNGNCSDSNQANYVLWNFYQATSVYMTGIAIEGSVLAPLATLKGDGGHIAGQVIVQYLTGGLEYHPYYFNGCLKY